MITEEQILNAGAKEITTQERAEILADRVMLQVVSVRALQDVFEGMAQPMKENLDRTLINECRAAFDIDRAHQKTVGQNPYDLKSIEGA